ncbi:hypothetical protein G5V59_05525 [Nocardioides sp. W3-2-3]|uniref:hypothetical protein n=1 Tax=Nocardioides convexus TaxID=2712224 RepID=UPI0024184F3C|nr:hypothetical protein [Nocardioides convexus]NGZ99896.1 hypothetical protein [Nocardioides convexus]
MTTTPSLRRLLQRGPGRPTRLTRLVNDADKVLPGFLSTGVTFTDMFLSYEPHLRALLQNYSPGLRSLLAKVQGGVLRIKIITDDYKHCEYHSPVSAIALDPRINERKPLVRDRHCSADFLQRGADKAPGPVR